MKKYLVFISITVLLVLVICYKDNMVEMVKDEECTQHAMAYDVPKNTVNSANKEEEINTNNIDTETLITEITLANGDKAQLLYKEEVFLRVNDKEIVVNTSVTNEMLFNVGIMPNVTFTLQQVNDNKLIAVTEHNPSMKYIEVIQRMYEIKDGGLHEFWKLESIDFDLIKVDKNILEIGFPPSSNTIKLRLTESEEQLASQKLKDIQAVLQKNELNMDESFWDEIKDNLITAITGCDWLDIDQDGNKEMIVSIYCYTVGASTPVNLREKGIMIYDVGETIELREIIFERDNQEDKLEQYFIGER